MRYDFPAPMTSTASPGTQMLGHVGRGRLDVADGDGRHAGDALDAIGQRLGGGGAQRLIGVAGGEDVGDHDLVGIGEGVGELVEQQGRAGVHVGLEDRPQTSLPDQLAGPRRWWRAPPSDGAP